MCHGNICRSVMAECVMTYMVAQAGLAQAFEIDSAAVSTEEIGNAIYPPARRTLVAHNIPVLPHAARQVTRADYTRFDYIICSDRSNLRWLERIIGADTDHKVSLLLQWAGEERDISDPWYTGDFEQAYSDIVQGCTALLARLSK